MVGRRRPNALFIVAVATSIGAAGCSIFNGLGDASDGGGAVDTGAGADMGIIFGPDTGIGDTGGQFSDARVADSGVGHPDADFVIPDAGLPPDPPAIMGVLKLWLRADHDVVMNSGGDITGWRDLSGLGHHFTVAGAQRGHPSFVPDAANGHPGISFTGISRAERAGMLGIPAESGRTFVAVAKLHTVDGRSPLIAQGRAGHTSEFVAIDANTHLSARDRFGVFATAAIQSGERTTTDPTIHVFIVDTMEVGEVILDNVRYRVNGAQVTLTGTRGASDYFSSIGRGDMTTLCTYPGKHAVLICEASILEVLVYEGGLSNPQAEVVEQYLATRYNITI